MKQVAIVTGVSGGIGYAVAQKLLENGIAVVGLSRSMKEAPAGEFTYVPGDVSIRDDRERLVDTAMEKYENAERYVQMAEEILDREDLEHGYYYAHTAEKIAGGFGYLGYFLKEAELKERAKEIYERT